MPFSVRQVSQTADEATHLYSGYRYLKCGDLTVSPEHPPLAKVIAAAPLLAMNFAVNCAPDKGNDLQQAFASLTWLYSQNWPAALAGARMAVSVFALGLCLLVWITARRMFGFITAVVASLLLIFEPNVLAYGSLVLTDVPVTCMLLFAVFGFYLWVTHRTILFFLLTALAAGLTLLTKDSGVVVVPILGALAITDALTQSEGDRPKWQLMLRNLLAVALICVLAVGILWAGYGMRFAAYPAGAQLQEPRHIAASASQRVLLELEDLRLLPQAYLEGFATALGISNQGSVAFVAGKIYLHAPWFSTPLNFLIRNTTAMLAMILVAGFGIAITFRQQRRERLFLLVPAAIYLGVSTPVLASASVIFCPCFRFCSSRCGRLRGVSQACALGELCGPCLLLLHAASSLHAHPNYLLCQRLAGGPARAYKYDSAHSWYRCFPASERLKSSGIQPKTVGSSQAGSGTPAFLQCTLPNLRSLLTSRDTTSRARTIIPQHSTYRRATSGGRVGGGV